MSTTTAPPAEDSATAEKASGEPAAHAVIGWYPRGTVSPWQGRYLHHAPSIADVASKLCQIRARHSGIGNHGAISELLKAHPAGWRSLGTTTAKDPEPKIRRRPAPPGVCLCHHADGTPTPAMISSGLEALTMIDHESPVRLPGYFEGQDPTAVGHWTINSTSTLPPGTDTLFLLGNDALIIGVRGVTSRQFLRAGTLPYHRPDPARLQAVIANAKRITSRTRETIEAEYAASALDRVRDTLAGIPAHHDLVLHLLGKTVTDTGPLEAALSRQAGIHPADLPGHLLRLDRREQTELLDAAAARLHPDRRNTKPSETL